MATNQMRWNELDKGQLKYPIICANRWTKRLTRKDSSKILLAPIDSNGLCRSMIDDQILAGRTLSCWMKRKDMRTSSKQSTPLKAKIDDLWKDWKSLIQRRDRKTYSQKSWPIFRQKGVKAYLKVCQSSKRTWPWFGMVNSKDRRSVKKKFIRYEETVTPEWDKMYETQLGRNWIFE